MAQSWKSRSLAESLKRRGKGKVPYEKKCPGSHKHLEESLNYDSHKVYHDYQEIQPLMGPLR